MRTLELKEDERFYYDHEAAERPIRFIEKHCRHHQSRFAGQLIKLTTSQRWIITSLYGWKRRDNHRRRFRELYLVTGKGYGKSPMFAAIGLYELFASTEASSHIVSAASTYKQAEITMVWAKEAIKQDPKLDRLAKRLQYQIKARQKIGDVVTTTTWSTLSGQFSGQQGFAPSLILFDELHEADGRLYAVLTANMPKRTNPLLLGATNAGPSRHCWAWAHHEAALRVLDGKSERTDLLPVICEAGPELEWDSEAAAIEANPNLNTVTSFKDDLAPLIAIARDSAAERAKYERLYLSRWIAGGATKWLDMEAWGKATAPFTADQVKGLPLYLGFDGSLVDDVSSLAYCWIGPNRLYVKFRNWIPKATAERYEATGIPYAKWATAKHITLLDSETIDHKAQARIAGAIRKAAARFNLVSLSYDPARASYVIARAERKGIVAIPVRQKAVDLTAACQELERRLRAGTITIAPNGCADAMAAEVELFTDSNGLCRPTKEGSRGRWAGLPAKKIDAISALVTCLTSVLRDGLAAEAKPSPTPQVYW